MKKGSNTISSIIKGYTPIQAIKKGLTTAYEGFKKLLASGIPPLTLLNCKNDNLIDYKVYGNSEQESGISPNLFDISGAENGSIYTSSGASVTSSNRCRTGYIYLEAGTYCASTVGSSTDITFGSTCFLYSTSTASTTSVKVALSDITSTGTRNYRTFTIDKAYYCRIVLLPMSGSSITDLSIDNLANYGPMIELGTEPSEYKPCGTYPSPTIPIEIESVGDKTKNLFDSNNLEQGGAIDATGVNATSNYRVRTKELVVLESGTYTISSDTLNFRAIHIYNYDTEEWEKRFYVSNKNVYTFTLEEKKKVKILLQFANDSSIPLTVEQAQNSNVLLEKGSTITEYEPYGYRIPIQINDTTTNIYLNEPLRKIGEIADYIDFENQKVVRNVKNKIFTGNETFNATGVSANTNLYRYDIRISEMRDLYSERILVSNYFTSGNYIDLGNSTKASVGIFSPKRLAFSTPIATVEEFKSWIASLYNTNPLYVYYPLEAPDDTEQITLPTISTYKGTTIIEIDTSITPNNIEVTYLGK